MEKVEIVGSVVVLASAVMVALLALTGVIK
jgi:hypothetical protein